MAIRFQTELKSLGQCQFCIGDDAQSTINDPSSIDDLTTECEEGHLLESVGLMNYLHNASDDYLSLPPNTKEDQTQLEFYGDGDFFQTRDLAWNSTWIWMKEKLKIMRWYAILAVFSLRLMNAWLEFQWRENFVNLVISISCV